MWLRGRMLLLEMGKVDQAEEMLKSMLELEPKNTPVDGLIAYGHLLRIHRHDHEQAAVMSVARSYAPASC